MKCSIKKFSEMYETVYRDLYRYALCLMKNPQEAEDAVSEAVSFLGVVNRDCPGFLLFK